MTSLPSPERRSFYDRVVSALLALLASAPAHGATKPDMVIFLADDHGYADSSAYGQATIRTPKMKELATQGMRFNNAFVASPACAPSRAALLTGLMPARTGAEANHMIPRPETMTMVRRLQEQGYEVAALGKVGHGKGRQMAGFDTSKDYKGHKGAELVALVDSFLDQRTSERPLCLMVGDNRPHVPWTKQPNYDPDEIQLPPSSIDTFETRQHWASYLTDVTAMDQTMAQIDKVAREHFGSDDFLFVYSSDHGAQWPFGKWNLYDRGIRVPLIIRWPEKIKAGSVSDAMVSWIDLMPTLIDIAGGPAPNRIDGRSFKAVLMGHSEDHRDAIFTTHTGDGIMNVYPIRSIRTKRFKYIRNLLPETYHSNHSDILRKDGAGAYWHSWDAAERTDPEAAAIIAKYYQRPKVELYDLENDPDEQLNLASHPEYRQRLQSLSERLDAWMKEQGDKQSIFDRPYPIS